MQESVHSVAKELEKNAKNAAAENGHLLSRVISALQLSSRESSEGRERLKEELEGRIAAVEEVRTCTCMTSLVVMRNSLYYLPSLPPSSSLSLSPPSVPPFFHPPFLSLPAAPP